MTAAGGAPSVCVALVTFNRKRLLLECLDALLQQTHPVDRIFILDNGSTDGTADLLQERGYLRNDRITLARDEVNTGGAGGFHRGLLLGQQAGFDWIWLMDDDAEPAPDALEQALSAMSDTAVSAVANFKVSAEGVPQNNHMLLQDGRPAALFAESTTPLPLRFSSFVGLLVRASVLQRIGLPRADFFLNGDDTEFCMRLLQVGTIALAPRSIIRHKEAARSGYAERSFFGLRHERGPFRAFVFRYFELRNTTVIYRLRHGRLATLLFALRRALSLAAAVIAFRDDHALQRLHVIGKSQWDALQGNFDNGFPFRMLRSTQTSDQPER